VATLPRFVTVGAAVAPIVTPSIVPPFMSAVVTAPRFVIVVKAAVVKAAVVTVPRFAIVCPAKVVSPATVRLLVVTAPMN
jgi:hypothetical protein